jgi:hypothetical protein
LPLCRCILNVLIAIHEPGGLYDTYVTQDGLEHAPGKLRNNPDFWPFFRRCIGALDGTHVPLTVPGDATTRYRCRKGYTSQNVLGVCTLEGMFSFIHAGWEGTAHGGTVLRDAMKKALFRVPTGFYFLGDAGYALSKFILTPFCGVRYHLKEWRQAWRTDPDSEYAFSHAVCRCNTTMHASDFPPSRIVSLR